MKVKIYSKTNCPYCVKAKMWFKNNGIEYNEVLLDDDEKRQAFYQQVGPNVKSVPQIYIDGSRLGGYNELEGAAKEILDYHNSNKFDADF